MATIIKNQILKHLSKFAKNLTPDQISVEILRGKSQLQNIILNEDVLTDVLELPAFLKIEMAVCNRITVKVPWTRLKTSPIQLFIDEINVRVVLTSELRSRQPSSQQTLSAYTAEYNSYGFANRVAEGMSLYINTLEVYFASEMFGGSIMLSRLSVESRTPYWHPASDLRQTRVKDQNNEKLLIFKQITWQLLRIEASALKKDGSSENGCTTGCTINAPLRLITSMGRCRILVKKSMIDGSVISGRMQLILDDILWVATLAQVRSALSFYKHLMDLIGKAAEKSKTETARKLLEQNGPDASLYPEQTQMQGTGAFKLFDIKETSYHCYIGEIDLHLTEDSNSKTSGDRNNWVRYKDQADCLKWIKELLQHYKGLIGQKLESPNLPNFESLWSHLMCQCCVMRIDDITVYSVSEITSRRESLRKIICSDREILTLPGDQPLMHAEFTDFYYPTKTKLPVPPGSTHVILSPLRVVMDLRTLRWLHYVYQTVVESLQLDADALEAVPHRDVRIEAIMPRLIVPCPANESVKQPKKPSELRFQLSTSLFTNCLVGDSVPAADFKQLLSDLSDRWLFQTSTVLAGKSFEPLPVDTDVFRAYLTALCELTASAQPREKTLECTTGASNIESPRLGGSAMSDLWSLQLSPLWIEFAGNSIYYPRTMPFVTDVPVTMWLMQNTPNQCIYGVAQIDGALKISVNHFEYLSLLHTIDSVQKFLDQLVADSEHFGWKNEPLATMFSAAVGEVELNLILPAQAPIGPYDAKAELQHLLEDPTPPSSDEQTSPPDAPNPELLRVALDTRPASRSNRSKSNSPRPGKRTPFPEFPDMDSETAEETMSIATDYSDDDQFVLLESPEGAPFDDVFAEDHRGRIEVGAEAMESSPDVQKNSLLNRLLSEEIAVLSLKLTDTELLLSSYNQHSRLTLQCHQLDTNEHRDLKMGELIQKLQTKVELVERSECVSNNTIPVHLCIEASGAGDNGSLKGRVHRVKSHISNASLANIAAFLQDDSELPQTAVKIDVHDTKLLIENEKMPNNSMLVEVEKCTVKIGQAKEIPPEQGQESDIIELRRENEELKRKLIDAKSLIQKLAKDSYNLKL